MTNGNACDQIPTNCYTGKAEPEEPLKIPKTGPISMKYWPNTGKVVLSQKKPQPVSYLNIRRAFRLNCSKVPLGGLDKRRFVFQIVHRSHAQIVFIFLGWLDDLVIQQSQSEIFDFTF